MIKKNIRQYGFGLLETVVASGILVVFMAGAIGLSRASLKNSLISSQKAQAYLLAQEGLEAVRQIRDTTWIDGQVNNWDDLFKDIIGLKCADSCGILYDDSAKDWSVEGTNDLTTLNDKQFTRTIKMEYKDMTVEDDSGQPVNPPPQALQVTAKVTWEEYGKSWNVSASTYLTDWKPAL